MAKSCQQIAAVGSFFALLRYFMGPTSSNISSYSCRKGLKLQNGGCYTKIRQELTSEMRKM